ncbi:hypothetical protein SISNIDRAFT_467474, partial [Sistotremastrum niveocremeum HHB9708]
MTVDLTHFSLIGVAHPPPVPPQPNPAIPIPPPLPLPPPPASSHSHSVAELPSLPSHSIPNDETLSPTPPTFSDAESSPFDIDDEFSDSDSDIDEVIAASHSVTIQPSQVLNLYQSAHPAQDLTVVPGTESFMTTANHPLFAMGYVIHPGFRVAICTGCSIAVSPAKLILHAKNHRHPILPSLEVDKVVNDFSLVEPSDVTRLAVGPPIPYLVAPESNFFGCPACSYAVRASSGVYTHINQVHPEFPNAKPVPQVYVQRLTNEKKVGYFQVDPSMSSNQDAGDVGDFIRLATAERESRVKTYQRQPPTVKHLDLWSSESKWHEALAGAARSDLYALGRFPTAKDPSDAWLQPFRAAVLSYFASTKSDVHHLSPEVLAQLNDPLPANYAPDAREHLQHQEAISLQRYAEYGYQILSIILRSIHSPCPNFPLSLSPAQQLAADDLYHHLHQPELSKASLQPLIHSLLFSLIQPYDTTRARNDFSCPLIRALVVSNLTEAGPFKNPHAISGCFSRLQWCIRGCVAKEIVNRPFPKQEHEAALRLHPLTIERQPTPFSRLRTFIHIVTRVAKGTPSKPTATWSRDHQSMDVSGTHIEITKVREGVPNAIDACDEELHEDILRGLKYPELDTHLHAMLDPNNHDVIGYDQIRSKAPGYSFLTDPRNGFTPFRYCLFRDLLHLPPHLNRFWIHGRLNPAELDRFFDQTKSFMEKFVIVSHVTCGGPSRASEVDTTVICVLIDGDRKLYLCKDHVCLLSTYSKTRHITGKDKMVMKALPPKVAFLLLKYLILVRPCEELFAPHVGMSLLQQENYSTHLFVAHGNVMKQELLRQLMRKISKDFFGGSFSWNQYRHFIKAVLLFIT